MGISLFGNPSWSSFDKTSIEKEVIINGNPNPKNFIIDEHFIVNEFLIIRINYPDAKNYEGNKILVFDKGTKLSDLTEQKIIDPHFTENKKYLSPIARFEPTARGIEMATILCKNYMDS